jgi:hypothetical protein
VNGDVPGIEAGGAVENDAASPTPAAIADDDFDRRRRDRDHSPQRRGAAVAENSVDPDRQDRC